MNFKFSTDHSIFSAFDILVGGIYPNVTTFGITSISRPYSQDDLTWCIQKAKYFPLLISFAFIAKPECWILYIFGVGYTVGFLLYLYVQLDFEYKHGNQRDWHYTTWLISLPIVIGINQRFQPKRQSLRFFYLWCLLCMMMAWQQIFFYGI